MMIKREKRNYDADFVSELLNSNSNLFEEYPIFEIMYNKDSTKKEFYYLASEKDIKETQLKSDENELDFKFSQNKITKEDYIRQKELIKRKLINQNIVYDTLIFDLIRNEEMDTLKEQIKKASLDDIELKRLAMSLSSIAEKKIEDFQKNNSEFRENNISEWNRRYDIIARNYAKTRELEAFILTLIE